MSLTALLLSLTAAIGFPLAAMSLKRAMELARNPWGVLIHCNLATALVFLPLFLWRGTFPGLSYAWQPVVAGCLFFLGQVAAFKSFQGDLSIGVTVQGAKILLVALLAVLLLGEGISGRVWIGAGFSAAAIHFLRESGDGERARGRVRFSIFYSALAALAFAAFDISVQAWSSRWGMQRFGPWAFLIQAILSLSLFTLADRGGHRPTREYWRWLIPGALGLALVTLAVVLAICISGQATQINLLFNSRCVWNVLFIWLAGSWFGNREAKSGRRVMAHRLGGACLMMAAIVFALI